MKNLLSKQEMRRYTLVEILTDQKDWLQLDILAKALNCSTRVLIDDIQYLNDQFEGFTLYTSKQGVKLTYHPNYGFKTFCQRMLDLSEPYKIFECVFLNYNLTVQELADKLFFSSSKVYRLINQINKQTKEAYDFQIETNPCRITGNEYNIRYIGYLYFFEKYSHYEWVFEHEQLEELNQFLERFNEMSELRTDFAYFNVFKVISGVNSIRYKQGHNVKFEGENEEFLDFILSTGLAKKVFETLNITYDSDSIEEITSQIFMQYIQPGFSLSIENFYERVKEEKALGFQVECLREQLKKLSTKHQLAFENIEEVVYLLFGTAHLEYMEPQSGHILYNRNKYFAEDIAHEFPNFYNDLYRIMKEFRKKIGKSVTEDGIYFYMYTVFTWWKNLVPELRRTLDKINVLVISDRHKTHASMLRDFIEYEFNEQLRVSCYEDAIFNPSDLLQSEYELVVSSFPIQNLESIRHVYISNVPKFKDYLEIKDQIDAIVLERISN